MKPLPVWEEALREVTAILGTAGYPATMRWAFRDDLWQVDVSRLAVRWPLPSANQELVQAVYAAGRSKGLAEIAVLGLGQKFVVGTVWFPKLPSEEVQGWNAGLKLSLREPLPTVIRVPLLFWPAVRCLPAYRRYQRLCPFIGSRAWAFE